MSASPAGKFQDHYAVLGHRSEVGLGGDSAGVLRSSRRNTIPTTPSTGSQEMFEAINMAYETLLDPELRGIFDKLKGVGAGRKQAQVQRCRFF